MIEMLAGMRFGMLTAIEPAGKNKYGTRLWRFACDCGQEKLYSPSDIRRGHAIACGCQSGRSSKHGDYRNGAATRLYCIWGNMKKRCENPSHRFYKNYGGRGITICPEWHDYLTFKTWALSHGYADNLEIDRKDNDGNYDSSNCCFTTRLINMSHTSTTITIQVGEESLCLSEWARRVKRPVATIAWWVKRYGIDGAAKRIQIEKEGGDIGQYFKYAHKRAGDGVPG